MALVRRADKSYPTSTFDEFHNMLTRWADDITRTAFADFTLVDRDFNMIRDSIRKCSYPKIRITTNPNCWQIRIAVPGIKKEEIDVEVNENESSLVINHKGPKQDLGNCIYSEWPEYSNWTRVLPFDSQRFDLKRISAIQDGGLLIIDVPFIKQEEKEPREIKKRITIG